MADDDITERDPVTDDERRAHFGRYEPGTPVAIGPEESVRLARLERSHEAVVRVVQSLQASRRRGTNLLIALVMALAGSLGALLVFAANRITSSAEAAGEARAELRAIKGRIDSEGADLRTRLGRAELEIDQLRATLLRLGAGEPHKPTSGPDPGDPDRYGTLDPQRPKKQLPHPGWGKILHSVLDEQMSLHTSGWTSSSRNRAASIDSSWCVSGTIDSSSCVSGTGAGGGWSPQDPMATNTIVSMSKRIPHW